MTKDHYLLILVICVVLSLTVWVGFFRGESAVGTEDVSVPTSTEPEISYSNASLDLIRVADPLPGSTVGQKFFIVGEARGYWFFEASFPIEVVDVRGAILVQTIATAGEEWMTDSFVPFIATVEIENGYTGPATVIVRKDNPSDIREHDAFISFPVIIE